MRLATSTIEFSFDDVMYLQFYVVAVSSPLGPALANIFVGCYEGKLFKRLSKPCQYVHDTFTVFQNKEECNEFLARMNSLHPFLRFTFEKENNRFLALRDVAVKKSDSQSITSTYRKPIFTGEYIVWNYFYPKKRKIRIISTFIRRALAICSSS